MIILYQEMFDGYFTSGDVGWLFYIRRCWMIILYQEIFDGYFISGEAGTWVGLLAL